MTVPPTAGVGGGASLCVEVTNSWAVQRSRQLPTAPRQTAGVQHKSLQKEPVWHGAYSPWHAPCKVCARGTVPVDMAIAPIAEDVRYDE